MNRAPRPRQDPPPREAHPGVPSPLRLLPDSARDAAPAGPGDSGREEFRFLNRDGSPLVITCYTPERFRCLPASARPPLLIEGVHFVVTLTEGPPPA